ncbi:MAG: CoB--CoM heterodisulfide reductase iron-sulfur subunit B family protein [Clostridia bacterium]|jgi:heterodisulfide reductase subunit B|nr:CoB--CoM heterodisulfide reductase iron-sulfur subunit B family protein [Clostridia bacterium]MDH7572196.1 CoB--CoM heterodisulfide reductase iron-sulfur subunit B family protein [Clostridia bacterium]
MARYSYYPGCSLHSTAAEYDLSTRAVLTALGQELEELEDWNCCGASSGHALSPYLAHALPLRNLVLAEAKDRELMVPCAACYNLLRVTQQFMAEGGEEADSLNRDLEAITGRPYRGRVRVRHLLEVLSDPDMLRLLKTAVRTPLGDLPVAAYYGCLLNRPRQVSFEEIPEQPESMERLLRVLGARPVGWSAKTDCCGASLGVSRADLVGRLVNDIVRAARRAGAQALVTACPLCQSNLDGRQEEGQELPVFFISELVGAALGLRETESWLAHHLVDPRPLLRARRPAVPA